MISFFKRFKRILCGGAAFAFLFSAGNCLAGDEGLLLVAFGTSHPQAKKAYEVVGEAFAKDYAPEKTQWAYTSAIIRKKLAKAGTPIPSIEEALDVFREKKVKVLRVQSLHIAAGEEFSYMERMVLRYALKHPEAFEKIFIGRPLLESEKDKEEIIKLLKEDMPAERKSDEAVLYMGHGQSAGRADMVLDSFKQALRQEDAKAYFATVEGGHSFEDIVEELKAQGVKTVWLMPFMLVAGDHAVNDLVGEEDDSWASRLKKEGFTVKSEIKGLGERASVGELFRRHASETEDDLLKLKK